MRQPSYGGRSDTLADTHRLRDGDRHYICWAGDVPALTQMRGIAQIWAESTDRYVASGRRFG